MKYVENNNNHVAVILGGTVPHAELIRQLKDRGYRTVLIDYFVNPPAAAFADVHLRDSAMDYDAVLHIAKEYHADLILSSCLDQQINVAMRAAEELGIAHPFSSETARKVTDKKMMKKIMMDNDIPTARYRLVDDKVDIASINLNFPLIVKPADSCGSAGIYRIDTDDKEKFDAAVQKAAQFSPTNNVLVEEYITGTEMSVHGYVEAGEARILFGTCKISTLAGGITMQLSNLYIPRLKDSLQTKLETIANKIVKAFALPAYTPLFMQCIVKDDDIYVIEFSPRVAGGTSSEVARIYTGFDLISYSIDSYLGKQTTYQGRKLSKYVCCFPIYARDGIFDHITGAEELRGDGTVHHEILLKSKGDHIEWSKPSSANVMKYLIDGDSFDECFDKLKKADAATDIIDKDGKSMRGGASPRLTHEHFLERLSELI